MMRLQNKHSDPISNLSKGRYLYKCMYGNAESLSKFPYFNRNNVTFSAVSSWCYHPVLSCKPIICRCPTFSGKYSFASVQPSIHPSCCPSVWKCSFCGPYILDTISPTNTSTKRDVLIQLGIGVCEIPNFSYHDLDLWSLS